MTDTIDRLGLTAAALALFADLPGREIDADEMLYVTEDAGDLIVWVPRSDRYYAHIAGRAYRFEKRDGVVEVTAYEDGQLVDFCNAEPHKGEDLLWLPWMK